MTFTEKKCVVIEGEVTRIENRTNERTVRTSDFLAELARQQALDTGLLPAGCALMSRFTDIKSRHRCIYVIERAHGLVSIQYSPDRKESSLRTLTLSWPRTLWLVRTETPHGQGRTILEDIFPAVLLQELSCDGLGTPLHTLPMPNIFDHGNGAVCMGNLAANESLQLSTRINKVLNDIITSNWNNDLLPDFECMGIESLDDWSERSALNAEFHKEIQYRPHKHQTLQVLLHALMEAPA